MITKNINLIREIHNAQEEIKSAYQIKNIKGIEDTLCKYTGPGTNMIYRNGHLFPIYNIYDEDDNLVMKTDTIVE